MRDKFAISSDSSDFKPINESLWRNEIGLDEMDNDWSDGRKCQTLLGIEVNAFCDKSRLISDV